MNHVLFVELHIIIIMITNTIKLLTGWQEPTIRPRVSINIYYVFFFKGNYYQIFFFKENGGGEYESTKALRISNKIQTS